MEFMVVGPGGTEYGPADVPTLKQWAAESRLDGNTMLRNFQTGQTQLASTVPGLFETPPVVNAPQYGVPPGGIQQSGVPQGNWSQPPAPNYYARPGTYSNAGEGWGFVAGIIGRCALALVMFFAFHGIGLIIAGYSMVAAVQGKGNGHRHGTVAVVIAGVTLALIGIGWALRLSSLAGPH